MERQSRAARSRAAALEAEADRAAGARRRRRRRGACSSGRPRPIPAAVEPWLKLAAMCRAAGRSRRPRSSAVSGALRVDPLGFLPLLLKANLLEQPGRTSEAGETYGHALAQRAGRAPAASRRRWSPMPSSATRLMSRDGRRGSPARSRRSTPRWPSASRRRLARFQHQHRCAPPGPIIREPSHFHYPGLREREFHDRERLSLARRARGGDAGDHSRISSG